MSNPPDERLSTRALFEAACAMATSVVDETEACHAHIALLQRRDPAEVWSLVAPLASSATPALQSLVPDVLRYLGGHAEPRLPLLDQTLTLFRAMLASSPAPDVIAGVGLAFVDLGGEAGLEMMLPFSAPAAATPAVARMKRLKPSAGSAANAHGATARRQDIPELVKRFVNYLAGRVKKRITGINAEVLQALSGYNFPSNVRELGFSGET